MSTSRLDRARGLAAIAVAVLLAGVLGWGVIANVRDNPRLRWGPGRDPGIAAVDAPLTWLGSERERQAFRDFKPRLHRGDTFALVIGKGANSDLVTPIALYYLYPATAVLSPGLADYVLVFGRVAHPPGFVEVSRSGDAWLGRRSR